jgi:hypothetical protein
MFEELCCERRVKTHFRISHDVSTIRNLGYDKRNLPGSTPHIIGAGPTRPLGLELAFSLLAPPAGSM